MPKQKLILIVGPTAVGKTDLGINLAQAFSGEIISGDSMQVYRHLDIGTAKVTSLEMAGVRHHLLDICNVEQRFTVADFTDLAAKKITQIITRKQQPFVVGGTGFYLQSLLRGYQLGGARSAQDLTLRKQLSLIAEQEGNQVLWNRLTQVDPAAAKRIPLADTRRIIRALEVYTLTGKRFSAQTDQINTNYEPYIIGLTTQRELLYRRINQRVDLMMQAGLLTEAKWLYERRQQAPQASKGIGYKEFFPYFSGECDLATAVSKVKQNSRHYAKRQLTFFRNQLPVHWYDLVTRPEDLPQIKQAVKNFLNEE
ncbi:tRNA (adenosine(37)-N6)-dimethylallyltransferase MiaA [Loigolactobacillus backii]|uniref:tRNA dimethylallyltransferase n=1 Tax=Loigolactobacillus backii TaxID=375175 RepID=A0A192H1R8_9LACO|nr:tRNA (adenosine(37)-N6)-dimethylallyltransferase MiaA [Loigolactobacillus backii]ANK59339.1 tRNA dimethylallyltransferase [Loigolactobacillus backii]ANK62754.1 tRNA dimethylallyltransferase [Loigolactobacillus backii]ANK64331.1 tRNA dimethylallyltransferase [Loigolactobacillus backii]ANK67273.1 tRNA (adenosine(37)-N6)-dimethylallyltransferase MiaA [Loigolactobacillus backii]ANK70238.1 tRNA dimethylallyltransferase [Loigolactobacillus backii]